MKETKEKRIEWGEIGKLANGRLVIYHKKTKKIKIERIDDDYRYVSNPSQKERKEVLKIVDQKFKKMKIQIKRWQKLIESIEKES